MSRQSSARLRAVVATAVALLVLLAAVPGQSEEGQHASEPVEASPAAAPTDGTPPGEATVGSDGREHLEEGDVRARMKLEGISYAEAEHRFHVGRAAGVVQNAVAARWPETFGGLWIDAEDFGVVVGFTEDAAAKVEDLRGAFAYPDELRAVTVGVSLAELERIHQRMITERGMVISGQPPPDMPAKLRQTGGRWDLDIDVKANTVVVDVEEKSTEMLGLFRKRYSQRLVMGDRLGGGQTCGPLDCRYQGIGGLRLNAGTSDSASSPYCSSAFALHKPSDGTQYLLSAGHCYTNNTSLWHRWNGGSRYGATRWYAVGGNKDFEAVQRYNTTWANNNQILVQNEANRSITGYVTVANTALGDYLGKSGGRQSPQYTTRGYVKSRNYSPLWDGVQYNGLIRTDMCTAPGDSGGAVFRNNNAYGNVVGWYRGGETPTDQCRDINGNWVTPPSDGGKMAYGAIEFALASLYSSDQIQLMTSSPPPPTTTTTATTTTTTATTTTTTTRPCTVPNPLGGCLSP